MANRTHTPKDTPLIERFWSKVYPEPNTGCWLWGGAGPEYGTIHFTDAEGKHALYAHRLSYEIHKGPIPEGLELDHLCRVTCCVNPDHLEPVTHLENVQRGCAGERKRSNTHCPHGHPWSGLNLSFTKEGSRRCRTCCRERTRRVRAVASAAMMTVMLILTASCTSASECAWVTKFQSHADDILTRGTKEWAVAHNRKVGKFCR